MLDDRARLRGAVRDRAPVERVEPRAAQVERIDRVHREPERVAERRAGAALQLVRELHLHHLLHVRHDEQQRARIGREPRRERQRLLAGRAVHLVVAGAVLGAAHVVPSLEHVARGVGRAGVERRREAHEHALQSRAHRERQPARRAGVTQSHEARHVGRLRAPDAEARDVELPVRTHAPLERRRAVRARQRDERALHARVRAVDVDAKRTRPAVREVHERGAAEAHLIVRHPHFAGARLVDLVRDPEQRRLGRRRIRPVRGGRHAVVAALFQQEDRRRRHEVPLLVARGDGAGARVHADDRLAQSGRERADATAVRRHLLHRARLTRSGAETGHDGGRRLGPEVERATDREVEAAAGLRRHA